MTETVGKRITYAFIAMQPIKAKAIKYHPYHKVFSIGAFRWLMCSLFFILLLNPQYLFAQGSHSKIKTIVIDAGHGGKDPGNIGTGRYKATESDVVLDVSLKLGKYINEQFPDIKVIYTRKSDVFIGLNERAKIANDNDADLFISIHCNAFKKPESHGTETWIMGAHKSEENLQIAMKENSSILLEENYEAKYEGFDPNSVESYIILNLIQSNNIESSISLANLVQKQFKNRVQRVDRGVKQAGFVVISKTTMPAILIEIGFLTNQEEEDFLNSDKGKDYMASAIFRAFKEYKALHEPKDGEGVSEAKGPTEEEIKKKEEEAKRKKEEEARKAKADSIAAEKKKAEEETKRIEAEKKAKAKAKADSLANIEAERKAKLIRDSIAKAEALKAAERLRRQELEKARKDSIAKAEAVKREQELAEKRKTDSIAKLKGEMHAKVEEAEKLRTELEKARKDSIAKVEEANKKLELEEKHKADSIAKLKEEMRAKVEEADKLKAKREKAKKDSIAKVELAKKEEELAKLREKTMQDSASEAEHQSEMQRQQELWNTVDAYRKNALNSRADFEKFVDAAIRLDDYLWMQSGEKDKTPEWKSRRSSKEYQKIYFAFELGEGQNVETFKALTMLFPDDAKYVEERAFAMYEQYISDKIKFERNGASYEAISYEKIIDASATALKSELKAAADEEAKRMADSIAVSHQEREERLRNKRDSLKTELERFRKERIEPSEVVTKDENEIVDKKKEEEFEERKEAMLQKIKPDTETIAGNKNIIFKIQLISSPKSLAGNSSKFNGITVEEYVDEGTYKYTTGNLNNLEEATNLQREMRKKGFADAFVVAFLNGERIPVSKAREILGID